jgi:CHAT domain-containing protein
MQPKLLKYLLPTLGAILLTTTLKSPALSQSEAQFLTQKGHEQLAAGSAEAALKTWQKAMEIYASFNDREGIKGSQINQSLALQTLGQLPRACQVLLAALSVTENGELCQTSADGNLIVSAEPKLLINAVAWRRLGDVFRGLGKLENSETALLYSLEKAEEFNSVDDISAAWLSLGNTARANYRKNLDLFESKRSLLRKNRAIESAEKAGDRYLQAAQLTDSNLTKIQSQLNYLSLLIELQQNSLVEIPQTEIESIVAELLQNNSQFDSLPLSKNAIYARLNFAESLAKLGKNDLAVKYAAMSFQLAETLNDKRTQSYSLGMLGYFYEQNNFLAEAEELTQKALLLAQSISASDISYQWQWQLGRIYRKEGKIELAKTAYDLAIQDLDFVRKDLLAINTDIRFSFREKIKPVYREYLEMLLSLNASKKDLEKAIKVSDLLQLAELENFLNCDLPQPENIGRVAPVIIYPIQFDDRLEVIVKLRDKEIIERRTVAVSSSQFNETISELNRRLTDKKTDVETEIFPRAQQLYDWLIKPVAEELPESGTLVFVLDSNLQGIPMAVLSDRRQYLVEKYSIAISLASQLFKSDSLQPGKWNALLAGVSEKAPSYPESLAALQAVESELNEIKETVPNSTIILNNDFEKEAFERQVQLNPFPVVHLATHGVFSSIPEETFIYAWDEKININQLENILQIRAGINREPIQLLVLSACQTAEGDSRAALGIAGVALRANARSTVASLWQVGDSPTAKFMGEFYRQLNQPNVNKAEAIRQVQIAFLEDENYAHPYYWAAFILAGNWQ